MREAAEQRRPTDTRGLQELARRCRLGDQAAIRILHFAPGAGPSPRSAVQWEVVCIQQGRATLAWLLPKGEPQFRPVPPGGIDFNRLHCLALDRLPELLAMTLPSGHETDDGRGHWCWAGTHPQRPELVHVNLLTGSWNEPNTGRAGLDLVSFFARVFGLSPGRAAHEMARWLGAEVRQYA